MIGNDFRSIWHLSIDLASLYGALAFEKLEMVDGLSSAPEWVAKY